MRRGARRRRHSCLHRRLYLSYHPLSYHPFSYHALSYHALHVRRLRGKAMNTIDGQVDALTHGGFPSEMCARELEGGIGKAGSLIRPLIEPLETLEQVREISLHREKVLVRPHHRRRPIPVTPRDAILDEERAATKGQQL